MFNLTQAQLHAKTCPLTADPSSFAHYAREARSSVKTTRGVNTRPKSL